jgi:hypothetical protein
MKWVWAIGTVCGTLSTTVLAAAEPQKDVVLHHDGYEPGAPVTRLSTVPTAPQPREFLRADVAYEAELRAELVEPPLWYGWQTLSLDGLLLAGGFGALQLSSTSSDLGEAFMWVPVVGFAVGGPTIHLIHHEPWRALGSFGLRAGLPVLGGAIGTGLIASCPPAEGDYGNCGLGELLMGVATGVIVASLIDGLALARESPKETPNVTLSLTPFISPDGTTRELRLRGSF